MLTPAELKLLLAHCETDLTRSQQGVLFAREGVGVTDGHRLTWCRWGAEGPPELPPRGYTAITRESLARIKPKARDDVRICGLATSEPCALVGGVRYPLAIPELDEAKGDAVLCWHKGWRLLQHAIHYAMDYDAPRTPFVSLSPRYVADAMLVEAAAESVTVSETGQCGVWLVTGRDSRAPVVWVTESWCAIVMPRRFHAEDALEVADLRRAWDRARHRPDGAP